jgi:hypothetical protein
MCFLYIEFLTLSIKSVINHTVHFLKDSVMTTNTSSLPQPSNTDADLNGVSTWCDTLENSTPPLEIVDSDCMDLKILNTQNTKSQMSSNLRMANREGSFIQVARAANREPGSHETSVGLQQLSLHQDPEGYDPKQRWTSQDDKEHPWVAIRSIAREYESEVILYKDYLRSEFEI